MSQSESLSQYLWISLYCLWIVSPVILCCFFPFFAKKVVNKFEKELLSANLGSICGFVFFEIVPVIIKDKTMNETQIYVASCTILLGILFGFFLGMLHQIMEHNNHNNPIQNALETKNSETKCLSC